MGYNARSGLQVRLPCLSALALHPERPDRGARFLFQCTGKIDNGAAGIAGALPVLASAFRIGGKEGKIHFGELLSPHTLDEVDFVARGFQLSDGLVVIKKAYIQGRKIAFAEHLGNFLALERGRTYDGRPIKLPAGGRGSGRCCDFERTTHGVCAASL